MNFLDELIRFNRDMDTIEQVARHKPEPEPEEPSHQLGCVCPDCACAELTAEND